MRVPAPRDLVSLREITAKTVRAFLRLAVAPGQEEFVAPNAVSIAQAYFEPKAWFRGIYLSADLSADLSTDLSPKESADGARVDSSEAEPVGFVMLSLDTGKPEYYLWRLMIADGYQRRGIGKRAIELIAEHVRELPSATELLTSYVPHESGPGDFYKKLGFVPTGEVDDGEIVVALALS